MALAGALFAGALALAFAFAGGGAGAFERRAAFICATGTSDGGTAGAFDRKTAFICATGTSLGGIAGAFDRNTAFICAIGTSVGGGAGIGTSVELEAGLLNGSAAISLVTTLTLGGFCTLSKISISLLLNSFSLFLYFANS